jgi:type I restriction enzyme, S subunit
MSFPTYERMKHSGVAWLGEVPEHWRVVQSRRLFSQRKERARPSDQQLTASQKHGVIYQTDFMAIEGQNVVQVIHGADILKHAEPDDFVISMRSFQGGIEWCGFRGSISSAYVMLIPSNCITPQFFRYLFKSKPYIQALQSTTNLVRDGQALRYENFTQVLLPVIPPSEQLAIAAFLDRETAKIDMLVDEQNQLIELLKEKRQAVISHAVTKGLDPTASMKDSKVLWIGLVPEHWQVGQLKRFVRPVKGAIKTGPFGSQLTSDEMLAGEIKVYSQRNVIDGDFDLGENFISREKFEQLSAFETFPGDVLVTTRGTIGKAAVLPPSASRGIMHPCLMRVQCNPAECNLIISAR